MNPLLALLILTGARRIISQTIPELPPLIPSQNLTQRLFHSADPSTSNATFPQAYQIDASNFRPGGPILFFQNPETPVPIASSQASGINSFPSYDAEELGALRVCLEHRVFGTSFPDGFTGESRKEYESLTLENIIADAVEFIKFVKSTVPGAEESKVVVTGGSYGGFLALMMKVREPEVFHGSIAMSPSFRGIGPLPEDNDYMYGFWTWISNMYYDVSTEASEKLKAALAEFKSCTDSGDCSSMEGLEFCGEQPNATELVKTYDTLEGLIQISAQFDYPVALQNPSYPVAFPVKTIASATLQAQTPGAIIQGPFAIYLNDTSKTCIDWKQSNLTSLADTYVFGSWSVIICSFAGISDLLRKPKGGLFPAQNVNKRVDCPLTEEWWGPDYNNTAAWWDEHLQTRREDLEKVERLLIVNGMHDPGSAYSELELTSSPNRNKSRVINVSGMSHSVAQFPEYSFPRGIDQAADEARDIQIEYIKQWVS